MPLNPNDPRVIGAFEATYNRLSSDHLPIFADVLGRGLSRLADLSGATNTFQFILGVHDQEARARWEGTLETGLHGLRANYAHSLSGVLDNLGAIPEGKGFGDPLEGLAAPVRQFYEEQSRAREEASREHGLRQQIASGAIETLGLLPEYLGVAAAASFAGLPALAALPLIMANRASRDPISGEFTGFGATARGAATGAAMHGVFAGARRLSTMPRRMGAAGGGMAGITAAVGEGSNQDIAASFFLGAGMAGLAGKAKGAQRDLKQETESWATDYIGLMEREYEQQGRSHSLLNGLKAAEERMERPQSTPENGVPRSYIDFEESISDPLRYNPKGPTIPDEGYPSTAIPGQAATQWQARLTQDAMNRGQHFTEWEGRLNVDRLFTPGKEREAAISVLNQYGGPEAFYGAHKGTVAWSETIDAARGRVANLLGEKPYDTWHRASKSRGMDETELAAIEMVFHARSARLDAASRNLYQGKPGAHEAFLEAATEYTASMYDLTSAASTAGRTLNILKAGSTAMKRKAMAKYMKSAGGKAEVEELNLMLSRLNDPAAVASMLRQHSLQTDMGMVAKTINVWKAGLLSGFATHMTNINSNAVFQLMHYGIEQPIEVGVGLAKIPIQRGITRAAGEIEYARSWPKADQRPLPGMEKFEKRAYLAEHRARFEKEHPRFDPANRLHAQELVGELWALGRSASFAVESVAKSFETGREFSPAKGMRTRAPYDTALGGAKTFLPFRLLTAADAGYKATAYSAELYKLGIREARENGVPWKDQFSYANDFVWEVHNPLLGTPGKRLSQLRGAMKAAMNKSEEMTFTNSLGDFGNSILHAKAATPYMDLVVPFFRTPVNVTKQGFYRTPMGILAPKNAADLAAGGERQNAAVARLTLGGLIGLAIYDKVLAGEITGATPTNEGERELQRSRGISPLSFKRTGSSGDSLMQSYARLEPLATPTAIMATMISEHAKGRFSTDDMKGAMELIAGTIAEVVVNRSMLQGPKRAMEALTQPEDRMSTYVDSMVGSVIPAFVNSVARGEDPFRRDQTGLPEAVWARLPYSAKTSELARKFGFSEEVFREGLPIMHDLVGRKMQTGDPGLQLGARMFAEFSTPLTPHPILDAMALSGAGIRRVSKVVSIRPKDMWSMTDQDIPMLGYSLQKELHIDMTPTEREWVNGGSNLAAANELALGVPILMATKEINTAVSLEALLGKGVPKDVVDNMRMHGVTRAAMIDAVRDLIRSTYSRHRKQYVDAVIDGWRQSGKLREEIEAQLTVENRLQQYRMEHTGGPGL